MSSVDTIVEIGVENTEQRSDATRVCGARHDFVEQGRATTSRLSREPLRGPRTRSLTMTTRRSRVQMLEPAGR